MEDDTHAHTFDHQIKTDGVSCSILLERNDIFGKPVSKPKSKNGYGETYIDDEMDDYTPLTGKHVVSIDRNMSDLLFYVDSDSKEQTKFRYTQATHRKESKAKKYRDSFQQRKQEVIDGKSVVEWEAELGAFNRKTIDLERYKAYIQKQNEINAQLAPFYIFRKLKLGSYMLC